MSDQHQCDTPAAIGCFGTFSRDIKAGDYHHLHKEKQAAGLLKWAISTNPDKDIIQLPTGGIFK